MRVPSEFRFDDRIDDYKRWRSLARYLFRRDLVLSPEQTATFGQMYYDADPLAEAFVDEVYLGVGQAQGRSMLEEAIEHGTGSMENAPGSLLALFEDIEEDPPWVDLQKVELGARVFRRWGTDVFRFAGAVTLLAYAENSVAKPLALTGGYAGDSTKRRFMETAAFWVAVSEPGGLRPGAAGRASALRVRMMHVFVRSRLLRHPEWDLEAWGVPINQADALLTLLGGSVGPGLALHLMGYRTTPAEIDATLHFWRYIGHLMGVRPRFFPSSITEAMQVIFVNHVKRAENAGDDRERLCRSFQDAFEPKGAAPLRDRVAHGIHRGMTRFFLPPGFYKESHMRPAGLWALYPLLQFPLRFGVETLRQKSSRLDDAYDGWVRQQRKRWLAHHLGESRVEYRARDEFTR